MFDLKKILFRGDSAPPGLDPELQAFVETWRAVPVPDPEEVHYHSRYVVVDAVTAGSPDERDTLLGLAAVGVVRGGIVLPDDVLALDFAAERLPGEVERCLAAFLGFVGQCPLVVFGASPTQTLVQGLLRERLGVEFLPLWIDLALLLPEYCGAPTGGAARREDWLRSLGIDVPPGRDAVANALGLARLFQVLLPRATEKGADTPRRLAATGRRFFRSGG
jgi:DNA polymerase-3 subunit epsilon